MCWGEIVERLFWTFGALFVWGIFVVILNFKEWSRDVGFVTKILILTGYFGTMLTFILGIWV